MCPTHLKGAFGAVISTLANLSPYLRLDVNDVQIRSGAHGGNFYEYVGPVQVTAPFIDIAGVDMGVFFAHKLDAADSYYKAIWMVGRVNGIPQWLPCNQLDPHPDQVLHPHKVLSLRKGKRPAWVTPKTAQKYAKEDKPLPTPRISR